MNNSPIAIDRMRTRYPRIQQQRKAYRSISATHGVRLAGAMTSDRRVTLFVDTSNHALRRVVWTSTRPLEPIPAKYLDDVAAEQREGAAGRLEARRPIQYEDTQEIEPTFDGPMEATAFDFKPPPTSKER